MEFEKTTEILNFIEMTRTDQSKIIAKSINNNVKMCAGIYFIYDKEVRLWSEHDEEYFITYLYNYFNNIGKRIKEIVSGLKDKRIELLLKEFDKSSYISDILKRMKGDIQDAKFIDKLDSLEDYLPIIGGKKICLKTMNVTDRLKEDYFTYECQVNITQDIQHAEQFFKQIEPNEENKKYLQTILGYCLTGNTQSRNFFVFYGGGSNAKTLVGILMQLILGKLYVQCSDEVFQNNKSNNAPSPHLACLKGSRIGFYSEGETADSMDLNIKTLKRFSGQDPITCRKLYGDPFTFRANCKLIMATNFVLALNAEEAIKSRLRYVFFDSLFKEEPTNGEFKKDPEFVNKLQTIYLNEVFTWILQGSVEYYKTLQITMPRDVAKRTCEILEHEDSIETF
jgi:putative DNA primase/helicase